jgi:pyruvate decarboxylase
VGSISCEEFLRQPHTQTGLSLAGTSIYPSTWLTFINAYTNWQSLGSFLRPGDIVIGETGTSAFGLCDSKLPKGVMMFNQTVYGSIGYATGSIVGVGQAIKESAGQWKRPILVTGEGSMHLTVQAIADMLRWDLKPIM